MAGRCGTSLMALRLAWLTDLHLNFVTDEYRLAALLDDIEETEADAVLIGGDTGEANSFAEYLDQLAATLRAPVYFVLGNHDYYRGSIAAVRQAARLLGQQPGGPEWLPDCDVVRLDERTALVGHGGWGDGRAGNFLSSDVVLNDYLLIEELKQTDRPPQWVITAELLQRLHTLGDEAAAHFRAVLPAAVRKYDQIIVLTHVPPFHQACWHEGQLSDDNWAPHFVCQAVGDVLLEFMSQHPTKQMKVLCGHTHSAGRAQILDNLEVLTGEAQYGEPKVQQVIET